MLLHGSSSHMQITGWFILSCSLSTVYYGNWDAWFVFTGAHIALWCFISNIFSTDTFELSSFSHYCFFSLGILIVFDVSLYYWLMCERYTKAEVIKIILMPSEWRKLAINLHRYDLKKIFTLFDFFLLLIRFSDAIKDQDGRCKSS